MIRITGPICPVCKRLLIVENGRCMCCRSTLTKKEIKEAQDRDKERAA